MTIDELIEAAKNRSMEPDAIKAFEERQNKRMAEEQEWADSQRVTSKWLNREYNI